MSRPVTQRMIRRDLPTITFYPDPPLQKPAPQTTLMLDGLEALRLADIEGLYQEEAAERMGVSRATFARILSAARSVVSDALVNGKVLAVGGGVVDQRQSESWPCPVHDGQRRRGRGCRCDDSSQTRPPRTGSGRDHASNLGSPHKLEGELRDA